MSGAAIIKMTITAAMLKIHYGPISNFFQTAFGLKCTKFHVFITKCTIFSAKVPHLGTLQIIVRSQKRKQSTELISIDTEKAFDCVNWKFHYQVLEWLGFNKKKICKTD